MVTDTNAGPHARAGVSVWGIEPPASASATPSIARVAPQMASTSPGKASATVTAGGYISHARTNHAEARSAAPMSNPAMNSTTNATQPAATITPNPVRGGPRAGRPI